MTFKRALALMLSLLLVMQLGFSFAETTATVEATPATEVTEEVAEKATEEATASETAAPEYVNPFPTMVINDMHEQPFDASVFGEKPFMLNIWASWCGPCVTEMPDLEELSKEYEGRMNIFGLLGDAVTVTQEGTLELNQDELEGAREFYEARGITYPSLIPNELMMVLMYQIQLNAFPTTLFIGADGSPLQMVVGSRSKDEWKAIMDEVLAHVEGTPHEHTDVR